MMEITAAQCSPSHPRLSSNCSSTSLIVPCLFLSKKKPCLPVSSSLPFSPSRMKSVGIKATKQRNLGVIYASVSGSSSPATDAAEERWLLEPVGDGDTRHIGFKVKMPGAFEVASSEVTVGRLPGRADMVIPVATVSGLHARIQKKGGNLLVTDLDSTNGTFIDDKRLRPGVAATVSSGSCITFGDIHLAMFRAFKLENAEPASEPSEEQSEEEAEANPTAESTEAAS